MLKSWHWQEKQQHEPQQRRVNNKKQERAPKELNTLQKKLNSRLDRGNSFRQWLKRKRQQDKCKRVQTKGKHEDEEQLKQQQQKQREQNFRQWLKQKKKSIKRQPDNVSTTSAATQTAPPEKPKSLHVNPRMKKKRPVRVDVTALLEQQKLKQKQTKKAFREWLQRKQLETKVLHTQSKQHEMEKLDRVTSRGLEPN